MRHTPTSQVAQNLGLPLRRERVILQCMVPGRERAFLRCFLGRWICKLGDEDGAPECRVHACYSLLKNLQAISWLGG